MITNRGILELEGMEFYACHGCLQHEKAAEQLFTVDFKAEYDMRMAAESDCLNDALNYASIHEIISGVMHGNHSDLIEHLAGKIIKEIASAFPELKHFSVRVSKSRPPVNGAAAWSRVTLQYEA